jgi:hypothetical protein
MSGSAIVLEMRGRLTAGKTSQKLSEESRDSPPVQAFMVMYEFRLSGASGPHPFDGWVKHV